MKHSRKEIRTWFKAHKASQFCAECGAKENIEFHHYNPADKKITISHLVRKANNFNALLAELKKCIPLCGGCHSLVHQGEILGWLVPDISKVELLHQRSKDFGCGVGFRGN